MKEVKKMIEESRHETGKQFNKELNRIRKWCSGIEARIRKIERRLAIKGGRK